MFAQELYRRTVVAQAAKNAISTRYQIYLPDYIFYDFYTHEPGSVSGSLYLDDGDSLIQPTTSYLHFLYAHGKLNMTGIFRYDASVSIASVTVLDTGSNGTKTTTDIKLTGAQKNIHV
ncbi:hypothetical protein LTR87_013485 [Friedmanniomyces endolithicus]|nr:hypothetical protein LTR87_013485 [Friedmanniomyces endolithicus]